MAIEYTLRCDGCREVICIVTSNERTARAHAQMNLGAYCGGGKDWCRTCRKTRAESMRRGLGPKGHSISTATRRD